jgi:phage gp36-like protein
MSYATLTDLIERAGDAEVRQIADRDRDMMIDQDVVDAALVHADNLVNGYLAVKYDVPLAAVPDLVRTWAVSIARYILHRNGAPEHVSQDYKDAVAALKDVAAGRIALPVAAGAEPLASAGGEVMASHPDEVFTADRLRGW